MRSKTLFNLCFLDIVVSMVSTYRKRTFFIISSNLEVPVIKNRLRGRSRRLVALLCESVWRNNVLFSARSCDGSAHLCMNRTPPPNLVLPVPILDEMSETGAEVRDQASQMPDALCGLAFVRLHQIAEDVLRGYTVRKDSWSCRIRF